ncbi:class I SAM-dependent methyltransferase [Noviherbaspirillum denitrificans]|uniref:Methylase n=1 Tax=Noviherbaspirillum denitrificans TaxID=1968433 RepID=A0A254TIM3_9BURK|nr:class I SAM-dependent methyltransferase [Noviherbaspirillum denitrificans]OWW22481.1 methylase [Noviherbaspirillum denitrificans]
MFSRRSGAGSSLRPAFFRIPAVLALLGQLLAFGSILLLAAALTSFAGIQISIAHAALVQGCVAAVVAHRMRLAIWWLPIQLCFPLAVVASHAVQLPPALYLGAFLFFLVLFWSTFRTQVPFYPSGPSVWRAVAQLLPEGRALRVADIGSGFGGMAMHLARARPECRVTGIELAPLPWIFSLLLGKASGSSARFVRGDYEAVDFADFDVVFAYLSPAAMPALWLKAQAEMRKGSLLLSYEFAIPGVEPAIAMHPLPDGPMLYGWRMG